MILREEQKPAPILPDLYALNQHLRYQKHLTCFFARDRSQMMNSLVGGRPRTGNQSSVLSL